MTGLIRRAVAKVARQSSLRSSEKLRTDAYIREWVMPKGLESKNLSTYVPCDWLGYCGLEMHESDQKERLRKWNDSHADVFALIRGDPKINTLFLGKSYLHNGYFCTPDAEIYALMIIETRPSNIIEIGGGFSTLIARKVCDYWNAKCEITVIDPEPRTDIRDAASTVLYKPVEEINLHELPQGEHALVFIDSSHVTRSRGDIPFIYNKLLPNLPRGVLVHVHDIFIPYDYPFIYQKRLYTEQYILHALLAHSHRYRVLFGTHFMSRRHPETMQAVFGEVVGREDWFFGGSFWFQVE